MKGPRTYDTTGLPLHADNQTVVKERIFLDAADNDLLHDEITTIDHALTRPWIIIKDYRREREAHQRAADGFAALYRSGHSWFLRLILNRAGSL
jgi:hypothetical protein